VKQDKSQESPSEEIYSKSCKNYSLQAYGATVRWKLTSIVVDWSCVTDGQTVTDGRCAQ